jgi:hypothetical protein
MHSQHENLLGRVFHFKSPEALANALIANNCDTTQKVAATTYFKSTGTQEAQGKTFVTLTRWKPGNWNDLHCIRSVPLTDLVDVFYHGALPLTKSEHLDLADSEEVEGASTWQGKKVKLACADAAEPRDRDDTVYTVLHVAVTDNPRRYLLDLVFQSVHGEVKEYLSLDSSHVVLVGEPDLEEDSLKHFESNIETEKVRQLRITEEPLPSEDSEDMVISFEDAEPEDDDYSFFLQMTMQSSGLIDHLLASVPKGDAVAAAAKLKSFVKELTNKG